MRGDDALKLKIFPGSERRPLRPLEIIQRGDVARARDTDPWFELPSCEGQVYDPPFDLEWRTYRPLTMREDAPEYAFQK